MERIKKFLAPFLGITSLVAAILNINDVRSCNSFLIHYSLSEKYVLAPKKS